MTEVTKYTEAELDQMSVAYIALMDKNDVEAGKKFIEENFLGREEEAIKFASLVREIIETRKLDQAPDTEVATEEVPAADTADVADTGTTEG